jgi:hypothetical protein
VNLADVQDEIAAQLSTIDGLRVTVDPPDKIQPPAAIVAMPDTLDFDQTYGRGSDRMALPVVVLVSGTVSRVARKTLAAYCDGSGAKSLKAVLEADDAGYTAMDSIVVTGIEFDVYQNGGVDYPAAIFNLDITGRGSRP